VRLRTLGALAALTLCLAAFTAAGCGDDDDDGGGGGAEGCTLESEATCEAFAGAAEFCAAFNGEAGPCSSDNLEATCAYQEDGEPATTRYYYKGEGGAAWDDGFGGTSEEDCAFYDNSTYTAK
jgi:hypothetical protein